MKYKKIQTEQQWLNEGIAKYGAWIPNWRFKCPCRTILAFLALLKKILSCLLYTLTLPTILLV